MIIPVSYIVVLFCTGSMTGPSSLCPYTDVALMVPLEVQYYIPGTSLSIGSIYGYQFNNWQYQFTIHRLISYNETDAVFKGDSNVYSEIMPISKITFIVQGVAAINIYGVLS